MSMSGGLCVICMREGFISVISVSEGLCVIST